MEAAKNAVARQRLSSLITHGMHVLLGRRLATWREAVMALKAEDAVQHEKTSHDDACWREAALKQQLDDQGEELTQTKKMVVKPTQLMRDLGAANQAHEMTQVGHP